MNIGMYEVGKVIPEAVGHAEGTQFDIDDSGAMMIVYFRQPTTSETEQFKAGKPFEIRFTEFSNVMFMTTKIGNLNWMDAPYNPHLSKNLTKFPLPQGEGEGLGLILMLIDAVTGKLMSIRLIGLSESFTKKLIGRVMQYKMEEFDIEEYMKSVNRILSSYDTKQIVKKAVAYCKV